MLPIDVSTSELRPHTACCRCYCHASLHSNCHCCQDTLLKPTPCSLLHYDIMLHTAGSAARSSGLSQPQLFSHTSPAAHCHAGPHPACPCSAAAASSLRVPEHLTQPLLAHHTSKAPLQPALGHNCSSAAGSHQQAAWHRVLPQWTSPDLDQQLQPDSHGPGPPACSMGFVEVSMPVVTASVLIMCCPEQKEEPLLGLACNM